jgi:hypothetical protein
MFNYYIGDLLAGAISLRSVNADTGQQSPFSIPAGSVVKILFPGTAGSVSIDSATALPAEFGGTNEIVITNAPDGDLTFTLIPAKGATIKPSVAKATVGQPIDVIISDSMGSQIQTFEITSAILGLTRANA